MDAKKEAKMENSKAKEDTEMKDSGIEENEELKTYDTREPTDLRYTSTKKGVDMENLPFRLADPDVLPDADRTLTVGSVEDGEDQGK